MSEIDCLRSIREEYDRTIGLLDFIRVGRGRKLHVDIGEHAVQIVETRPYGKVVGRGGDLLAAIQDAIDRYDAEEGRFHSMATRHRKPEGETA